MKIFLLGTGDGVKLFDVNKETEIGFIDWKIWYVLIQVCPELENKALESADYEDFYENGEHEIIEKYFIDIKDLPIPF